MAYNPEVWATGAFGLLFFLFFLSRKKRVTNWEGQHSFVSDKTRYCQCETVEQVVDLVRSACSTKHKIKVVGAGHSWSHIAVPDPSHATHFVNLDGLSRVLEVDHEALTITVEAGMRLSKLVEILHENKLALHNLPSITEQSIAGAICTATHGSGSTPNLSASVLEVHLVDGQGQLHVIKEGDRLLPAAQVSLGSLGIIVRVKLRCVPAYKLRLHLYKVSFDQFLVNFRFLASQFPFVKFWWWPHADSVMVYQYQLVDADTPISEPVSKLNWEAQSVGGEVLMWLSSWLRWLTPLFNRIIVALATTGITRFNWWHHILPIPFRVPRHSELEYALPIEHCVSTLQDIRQWIRQNKVYVNNIIEIRVVKSDTAYLSNNYQQDSAHITLLYYNGSKASKQHYFRGIEQILTNRRGRPHWAKEFSVGADYLSSVYPGFEEFRQARQLLDPHRIFSNQYLDSVLGS